LATFIFYNKKTKGFGFIEKCYKNDFVYSCDSQSSSTNSYRSILVAVNERKMRGARENSTRSHHVTLLWSADLNQSKSRRLPLSSPICDLHASKCQLQCKLGGFAPRNRKL